MKSTRKLGLLFCMAILIVTFSLSAKADEFDKLTIFTFSAPVELPGRIDLPAGTYIFKLLDNLSTSNLVQIFNQEQTEVYATILTISAERLRPTDETVVEFYHSTAGAPNALKTWFYPGDSNGQEFVYPKERSAEFSKNAKEDVTVISSHLSSPHKQP